MNKLLTKIVGVVLGTTMAVGVGVGVVVNNSRDTVDSQVNAAGEVDDVLSSSCTRSALSTAGATSSSWATITTTGSSGVSYTVYSMLPASGDALKWNKNGYLYTTTVPSGKIVTGVSASSNKTLNVFGSSTAFSGDSGGTALTSLSSSNSYAITVSSSSGYKYIRIHGSTSSTAVGSVTISYANASSDPTVNITNTGSSTRMLNKNGDPITIGGISATGDNLGNAPYYVWSITNNNNCDAALSNDANLHTSTPTITASASGSFDLNVAVYNEQGGTKLVETGSPTTITVKSYGGSISWTGRSSLKFREGVGFIYSTATFTTTMYDGTVINYGGDYSNLHIYAGDTEVDNNDVDATYCSTSRSYKMYDSEHEAWSSLSATTLTFEPKATIDSLSVKGNVTTIRSGQIIKMATEVSSTGWGNSVTYSSSNSSVLSVNGNVVTAGNTTGSANVIATLENGNSVSKSITVDNSYHLTTEEACKLLTANNVSSGNYYDTSNTQYYVEGFYYKSGTKHYISLDAESTSSSYPLQLYKSGLSLDYTKGTLIRAHGRLMNYSGTCELADVVIDSATAPATTGFTISGPTEVYVNDIIELTITDVVPSGASKEVNWTTSDTTNSEIDDGVFTASKSGVYTITATSTSDQGGGVFASDTHEVHVFELQEVAVTLKNSPKTKYFVGEEVESNLFTASVKYKCGSTLNYKTEDVSSTISNISYKYNNATLTNATFSSKNESGATLEVVDFVVTSSIYPEDNGGIMVKPENISVSNVKVYDIEIDVENCSIETTSTTQFGFGGTFSISGTAHIAYLNGYQSKDVSLDDEDIAIDTPNMKQLGSQTLDVDYDDPDSGKIVTIGSITITITNSIDTNVNDSIVFDKDTKDSNNQNVFGSYISETTFTVKSGGGDSYTFEQSAGESFGYCHSSNTKNYIALKKNTSLCNNTSLVGLSHFKLTLNEFSGSVDSGGLSVYSGATKNSETHQLGSTLTAKGTIDVDVTAGDTYIKISQTTTRVAYFTLEITLYADTFTAQEQAIAYAQYFNSQVGELCDAGGNTSAANVTAISGKWSTLKTEYLAMTKDAKDYFADHASQEDIARTIGMYTKIVERYELENFMVDGDGNKVVEPTNSLTLGGVASNTSVVATVVIISVISLSTLCGYFLLRKRKEER